MSTPTLSIMLLLFDIHSLCLDGGPSVSSLDEESQLHAASLAQTFFLTAYCMLKAIIIIIIYKKVKRLNKKFKLLPWLDL